MTLHYTTPDQERFSESELLQILDASLSFPWSPKRMPSLFEFTCQPVHRSELTAKAIELALRSVPWDENNPFVKEDHHADVFMRFDGLEIKNSHRDPSAVDVGFLWQGTVMCWLDLQGARLEGDTMLHLRGIEGRQRVTLS